MMEFEQKKHLVLYSFRRCPYAMRARMGLYKAGMPVELREVDLKDKPETLLDLSPKGTVPVLLVPEGTVIDESLDIILWALRQNDPDGWLDTDMNEAATLIDRNDHKFKKALDRYKYPNRYPGEDCAWAQQACEETLKDLNRRLENHAQLLGDKVTIADIALFPFIRQCAFVNRAWFESLPYAGLQQWLDNHLNSPLFKNIMLKLDIWKQGDAPVMLTPMQR